MKISSLAYFTLALLTANNALLANDGDEQSWPEITYTTTTNIAHGHMATERGLMLAIKHKNYQLVEQLLSAPKHAGKFQHALDVLTGTNKNYLQEIINKKMPINGEFMSPLELAARQADPEMVRLLIRFGAKVDSVSERPVRSYLDLFHFVGHGEGSDLTRSLLEEHWRAE